MVSENEVSESKFEEASKDVFEKVKDFNGDIESKEYEELLDDFIKLNTDLFLLLETEDLRRLRHRLRTLKRIFDLKCKKFKIKARD